MKFTDDTKQEIRANLADKRKDFLSSTLEMVEYATNKYYRIGLEQIQFGDIHSLKDIIKKTILDYENPTFSRNAIIYKIKDLKTIAYEELNAYFSNYFLENEEAIKNDFWLIPNNQNRFNQICNFRVFSDLIVDKSEVANRMKYGAIFEVSSWQKFHQSLITIFLPEFKFDIKLSSKTHRYVKQIDDNLFLCLEYDFKKEQQALVRSNIDIGKYRLVLLNRAFNRKTKSEEYYNHTNTTILNLGNAVHPIFNNPCTELFRFFARENVVENSPGNISFKYLTKYEHLPNHKIRLYNSEQFGDTLKRHAFFYMDIYSYYFKQYLQFLETCLITRNM